MSTTSIHVTLPQALKDHIEKRVAEGEFTSPSDYVRRAGHAPSDLAIGAACRHSFATSTRADAAPEAGRVQMARSSLSMS